MGLHLKDVLQTVKRRGEHHRVTFDKVLDKCNRLIERSVSIKNASCFYQVPEFMIGYPLYDINDCINYMYGILTKNGFLVKYYFPNVFYISWHEEEIENAKFQQRYNLLQHTQNTQHTQFNEANKTDTSNGTKMIDHAQQPKRIGRGRGQGQGKGQGQGQVLVDTNQSQKFVKSIRDFKPSGKFVLDL